MLHGRSTQHVVRQVCQQCRGQARTSYRGRISSGISRRAYSTQKEEASISRQKALVTFVAAAGLASGLIGDYVYKTEAPKADDNEPIIEQRRKRRDGSKEANRDAISTYHVQVKQSWENPGVFTFGSNSGKVADPGSKDSVVKNPKRIAFFDGYALRDLKLDRNFGAAVDGKGDLYVWGNDYSTDATQPEKVLIGKKLRKLAISQDRIFGLTSGGKLYSVPVSKKDQLSGERPYETSWIPFWPSRSKVAYKIVDIPDRNWGETITEVSSGLEHALFLTSTGRLFSFASSSTAYPSRGQLGIPGITSWDNRPSGPYDRPHPVATLSGFKIVSIATGAHHSIVLDDIGRVFGFGDNSSGQLGINVTPESPYIDAPSLQNTVKLYAGTGQTAKITGIAAGGAVSFMTVDATRVATPNDDLDKAGTRAQLGKVSADVWAFGQGIYGTLGTGRWTHVQAEPARVRSLSGLFEYDEAANAVIPIRLARVSVGATHAAAIMDNVTHVGATARSGQNDVNWGADVLWWGGNEFYQLGTGRRANVSVPAYIGPLEDVGDGAKRDQHRLHITPPKTIQVQGVSVKVEQSVECGRMVSAVYSRIVD